MDIDGQVLFAPSICVPEQFRSELPNTAGFPSFPVRPDQDLRENRNIQLGLFLS
jgi:hypothetical protein